VLSFCEMTSRDHTILLPSATGFGGGIGRCGCICGALAGGIIALGSVYGRKTLEDDKKRPYRFASQLCNQFVEEYGSSCCRIINKGDFKSSEHQIRCSDIVEKTAVMLLDIIEAEETGS